VLDVLAAAQAASGRFDLAVMTCDEARALISEERLAGAVKRRCDGYRQKRPYISQ
jgi:hypothetical protein